ncbi:unnamed protein product [Linum tenue]|uniref:chorismate mutase n=1 Tax=Linum tenue TaxID=586396 RepID=A0AAV0HSR3_9ROSI|nr:unnamed protein product [Linum tenue]
MPDSECQWPREAARRIPPVFFLVLFLSHQYLLSPSSPNPSPLRSLLSHQLQSQGTPEIPSHRKKKKKKTRYSLASKAAFLPPSIPPSSETRMEAELLPRAYFAPGIAAAPTTDAFKFSSPLCCRLSLRTRAVSVSSSSPAKHRIFCANSSAGLEKKERVDESDTLTLESVRLSLIRQEDSIIYNLLERSQYCYNADTYNPDVFSMNDFHGSLVEYILKETEKLHAKVGRYKSPDEYPFFPNDLPEPLLPPMQYPKVLHKVAESININDTVWNMYFKDLLPRLVKLGNDGNCGSSAVCDTICLQDREGLMALLTYPEVEERVKERVELKARTFALEVTMKEGKVESETVYKIEPDLVADLYGRWIMPLTKEVQVEYLLRRLD